VTAAGARWCSAPRLLAAVDEPESACAVERGGGARAIAGHAVPVVEEAAEPETGGAVAGLAAASQHAPCRARIGLLHD
jgi:hypothetical protein